MNVPLPALHQLKPFIDLSQSFAVSDEFIHFDLLLQVSSDHLGHAIFTFKAWSMAGKHEHANLNLQFC